MTRLHSVPPPRKPMPLKYWLVLGAILAFGLCLGQHFRDQRLYQIAQKQYQNAECPGTIQTVNRLLAGPRLYDFANFLPRARQTKTECSYLQQALALQSGQKPEPALWNFTTLAQLYPSSSLLDAARSPLTNLFNQADPTSLASERVCTQIKALTDGRLLPEQVANVPNFYLACGLTFEQQKNFDQAIDLYEQAAQKYNDPQLEQALARTIVAQVKERGAGEVQSPQSVGPTDDGSTLLEVQNSAPREMELTFSGPTPRFEKIPPCPECQKYNRKGPETCPETGPTVGYFFIPGQHDMVVKFNEKNNERINTWYGEWQLEPGQRYKTCFYLVQNPDLETLNKQKKQPQGLGGQNQQESAP